MKQPSPLPIIGITLGDPAGIGPEIILKLLNDPQLHGICRPLIIGDSHILKKALDLLGLTHQIHIIDDPEQGYFKFKTVDMIDIQLLNIRDFKPSVPSFETGRAMQAYVIRGIDLALNRKIDGLVTCPITKTALKLAGSDFHGHTELLAHRTGAKEFAMMLAGRTLRVVLVTIHIPLAEVPASLTRAGIIKKIRLTHTSLKDRFNIKEPRIAVAGLNPHSGEDAMFGCEEKDIILPAVQASKDEGIHVQGPLPPDTVFYHAAQGRYDAVVCMYHDQGLIPFKLIHFKDGVNTTLGLPIIRTSVDHGTAYDIAWKGIADPSSLMEAVKMAAFQADNIKTEK
ncbi:MAG: 4-hydroxythreonine-4-phosphate dehydrogenase PdxA [Desulfobacteraceae bacterium]|nr:4-hydroxythreonine-4-phosphate dehydrogenase PdxA [Desulfobacteraceae bacterium]